MNAWNSNDINKVDGLVVGASETDLAISKSFRVSAGGAKNMRIDLIVSSVTASTGITVKLQSSPNGGSNWIDAKTVSVTGNGLFSIKLLAEDSNDHGFLPLSSLGRVVITTGAGDAVTIDDVFLQQED